MKITRVSPVTGIMNTMDLPVTLEQMNYWRNGATIQQAMPHLSDDQREFILSGCTPQDWEELFGEEN
jgi:hypothetical protein